jgi:LCP family protein required for cell wall assembly
LLKDTILYNLGIEVDYFVRIGFDGFKRVIDALGGIELIVTCPLQDWRLISAELDPQVEENYEQFKLDVGIYDMDGDLALWYARSRITTNDADRARRQQQLLSAMLAGGVDAGMVSEIPELWSIFKEEVETDLDLGTILRLAPLAGDVRENGIRHLSLSQVLDQGALLPETNKWIALLRWDDAAPIMGQLMSTPVLGRSSRAPLVVDVHATSYDEYRLAAENLSWWGFIPSFTHVETSKPANTTIEYHGNNFKGSFDHLMRWLFNDQPITLTPDPNASADYTVVLGSAFNTCRNPLYYQSE